MVARVSADIAGLLVRKLGAGVSLSSHVYLRHSALTASVFHVNTLVGQYEVVRVDAQWFVAGMHYDFSVARLGPHTSGQFIHDPVGLMLSPEVVHHTVAGGLAAAPQPAAGSRVLSTAVPKGLNGNWLGGASHDIRYKVLAARPKGYYISSANTDTETSVANPYEDLNRQRKARRIIAYIWGNMKAKDRIDAESLNAVRNANQEMRDLVASLAECTSPSAATWALVTKELSERMQAERFSKEQTA